MRCYCPEYLKNEIMSWRSFRKQSSLRVRVLNVLLRKAITSSNRSRRRWASVLHWEFGEPACESTKQLHLVDPCHVGTWSHIMSNGCPPGSRQIGGSGSSWSCFAHHKAAAKNNATGHTGEQPEAGTPAKPPSWHETRKTDRDWRACLEWKVKESLKLHATRLPIFGSATPFKQSCEPAFLWSVGCKSHLAAKNPPMGGAIKGPRSIDAKSSPAT